MSENCCPSEDRNIHAVAVNERTHVEIRGMTEVISFDENAVVLATTGGNMSIEGSGLKVNILDVKEGNISVDGHIDCVYYFDPTSKQVTRGWFGRLFH
jgi:sporulation protein YabP